MGKLLVEFIGTFFLVLTVGCTIIDPGAAPMIGVAIGAVLMVMIYAGGHISGAHYNPAVTIAVWTRGKCPSGDVLPYILAQLLGSGAAVAAVSILKAPDITPFVPVMVPALVAEFLFTFALAYVVLNVATAPANEGNSFYGLAIGMTVTVAAYAIGNISGAALNPAVLLGAATLGMITPEVIVPYLIVQLLGGLTAGIVYNSIAAFHPVDERVRTSRLTEIEQASKAYL